MDREQFTPDQKRMIIAVGDLEAHRLAPEEFQDKFIPSDKREQPQHEAVTALYQVGIFAYNGTASPALTEKGREAYNDLDRTRTDRPPVKIEQRQDRESKDPTKFFTQTRKAQDDRPTDPEQQKGMSPEALQAARNLVQEADKAVTLMQQRGIGMNEAGLSKALQAAHAAGIEPPEKEPRTMKFSVFRDPGSRERDDPGREPER